VIARKIALTLLLTSATGAHAAINVVGLEGDFQHGSEFLFGFSGGIPNHLSLGLSGGGSVTLSTGTSLFGIGNNQGWWSATFGNSDGNDNWIAGDPFANGTTVLNNFFTFDLTSLFGQTIVSATLEVTRASGQSTTGQTSHTYHVFDVATAAATLNATNGTSAAITDDLGSGTSYGSFSVTVAGSFSDVLSFNLNAAALADINSALANSQQFFSVGGTIFPLQVGAVPEPGMFMVWALLAGIGLTFGRRYFATTEIQQT
jgi:hypothetical protein